jgi:hypothetical protein
MKTQGVLKQQNDKWFVEYKKYEQVYPRSGRDAQGNEQYDWVIKQLEVYNPNNLTLEEDKNIMFEDYDLYVEPPPTIHSNRGGFKKVAKLPEQIQTISYGEGCFGAYVKINNKSINRNDYTDYDGHPSFTAGEEKILTHHQTELINELTELMRLHKLDTYDFRTISEIIISKGQWEQHEDKSYSDACDQCGNYNWGETYTR